MFTQVLMVTLVATLVGASELGEGDPRVLSAGLDFLQRVKRITDAAVQYFNIEGSSPSLPQFLESQHARAVRRVLDLPLDQHRAAQTHMHLKAAPRELPNQVVRAQEEVTPPHTRGSVDVQEAPLCIGGVSAVSTTAVISCGSLGVLTGAQVAALNATSRNLCSLEGTAVCVCSADYTVRSTGLLAQCLPRTISCDAHLDAAAPPCQNPFSPYALPLETFHCVTSSRLDTLSIDVSLQCRTAKSAPPTTATLVVLGRPDLIGSYDILSNSSDLFHFSVHTPTLSVSASNPVLRSTSNNVVFATLHSLKRLSKTISQNVSLSPSLLSGNTTTFNVDLSDVPDDYVSGGVVYAEVGLLTNWYIFDNGIYAASLFIRIAAPRLSTATTGGLSTGAIVGIVVACVAAVALIGYLAQRCYTARRSRKVLKEE